MLIAFRKKLIKLQMTLLLVYDLLDRPVILGKAANYSHQANSSEAGVGDL